MKAEYIYNSKLIKLLTQIITSLLPYTMAIHRDAFDQVLQKFIAGIPKCTLINLLLLFS